MKGFRKWMIMLAIVAFMGAAGFLAGCDDSDSDSGSGEVNSSYGGSIPRGDYVTAEIEGDQITITNKTTDMEHTLAYGDLPENIADTGFSIVKVTTEPDRLGNYYLMTIREGAVLGLQKTDSDLTPIRGELPIYTFSKTTLTADDLKGRAYNYMELFSSTEKLSVEVGIVGFDTEASGRLYGAAYDSEDDDLYSITDEDGIPGNDDEFTLEQMESQSDGSLVLWEDGVQGSWINATTLTGSASGALVLDHGPGDIAGGGAGFALPQVTETDPDAFWDTVAGSYLVTAYASFDGNEKVVEFYRCKVSQDVGGNWSGILGLYYPDEAEPILQIPICPLTSDRTSEIDDIAAFSEAESETVQNAASGRGIFQEDSQEPDFFITFDPQGNYLLAVKAGHGKPSEGDIYDVGSVTGYGLGIKDPNWTLPE